MKETKLEIPADCEVDKIETQEGHIVVTFKEKERKLPKSWEEFCEMFPIKKGEAFIDQDDQIKEFDYNFVEGRSIYDTTILPDRATAEAVRALCQLIQLRNCYNGDWMPDWTSFNQKKYIISPLLGDITHYETNYIASVLLYFKTEDLRDEFMRNFSPLIEKLKPLYGIMEGGEE